MFNTLLHSSAVGHHYLLLHRSSIGHVYLFPHRRASHLQVLHFLSIKYLHVNIQCLAIVYTKYRIAPEENMEGLEFLIQVLSKQFVEY